MAFEQQIPTVAHAQDVVKAAPSVTVQDLPDGRILFEVEPPKRKPLWVAPVLGCGVGVLVLVVGNWMRASNPGLPPGYVWRGPVMLMVLGALCIVFGPMVALIQVMQGPPRKVTLEARPGLLKADRSIGGDRVVSTYGAAEVDQLFVEDSVLFATTQKGDQQLIAFREGSVNRAIAVLLAERLWQEGWVGGQNTRRFTCIRNYELAGGKP